MLGLVSVSFALLPIFSNLPRTYWCGFVGGTPGWRTRTRRPRLRVSSARTHFITKFGCHMCIWSMSMRASWWGPISTICCLLLSPTGLSCILPGRAIIISGTFLWDNETLIRRWNQDCKETCIFSGWKLRYFAWWICKSSRLISRSVRWSWKAVRIKILAVSDPERFKFDKKRLENGGKGFKI